MQDHAECESRTTISTSVGDCTHQSTGDWGWDIYCIYDLSGRGVSLPNNRVLEVGNTSKVIPSVLTRCFALPTFPICKVNLDMFEPMRERMIQVDVFPSKLDGFEVPRISMESDL